MVTKSTVLFTAKRYISETVWYFIGVYTCIINQGSALAVLLEIVLPTHTHTPVEDQWNSSEGYKN